MGRKTIEATGTDRLIQASAEAAAILSGDLAACSRMMRSYLDAAAETTDEDLRVEFIHCATELAGAVGETERRAGAGAGRDPPIYPRGADPSPAPKCTAKRTKYHRSLTMKSGGLDGKSRAQTPKTGEGGGAMPALRLPPNCHPGQAPHRGARAVDPPNRGRQASKWVTDRPKGRPG